jgi:hypothetical protein
MSRVVALVGLAVLLATVSGCAPSLESKLIGRWKLDTSSLDMSKVIDQQIAEQTEGNEAAAAMAQAMGGMLKGMLDSMKMDVEMDFRPDHTLNSKANVSVMGQNKETMQTGTWKVEATGDNQLTVVTTMSDGKTNTVNLKFIDDNTITATGNVPGAGDQQVKFLRVQGT